MSRWSENSANWLLTANWLIIDRWSVIAHDRLWFLRIAAQHRDKRVRSFAWFFLSSQAYLLKLHLLKDGILLLNGASLQPHPDTIDPSSIVLWKLREVSASAVVLWLLKDQRIWNTLSCIALFINTLIALLSCRVFIHDFDESHRLVDVSVRNVAIRSSALHVFYRAALSLLVVRRNALTRGD